MHTVCLVTAWQYVLSAAICGHILITIHHKKHREYLKMLGMERSFILKILKIIKIIKTTLTGKIFATTCSNVG